MSEAEKGLRTAGEPDRPKGFKLTRAVSSCADIAKDGMHLMALAPVYQFTHMDFNIMPRYAAESKRSFRSTFIEFPFKIFNFDGEWSRLLHVIDETEWPAFLKFLPTVCLSDRKTNDYYEIYHVVVTVPDPLARMKDPQTQATHKLDMFLTSGMKGMVKLKTRTVEVERVDPGMLFSMPVVELEVGPADPKVVSVGRALLEGRK